MLNTANRLYSQFGDWSGMGEQVLYLFVYVDLLQKQGIVGSSR